MEAVNLSDYDFIMSGDSKLKKEDQTIWVLRVLDYEQDAWLENKLSNGLSESNAIIYVLSMGLKNVKKFWLKDAPITLERVKDGKDVEKLPGGVLPLTSKFLSLIPKIGRGELSLQIRYGVTLGAEDSKNS